MTKLPLAVAHRGFSARYPENTTMAFEAAIKAGSDYIETDVRMTADGVLACSHDPDLERLSGDKRKIADAAFDDLSDLDIGGGHGLLQLADVLNLARGRVSVLVDTKELDTRIAEKMIDCVADDWQFVTFGLRNVDQIHFLKRRNRAFSCLALLDDYHLIPKALAAGVNAVRIWEDDFQNRAVRALVPADIPVWVTAGRRADGEQAGFITAKRLAELAEADVSAVLLNDPSLMLETGKACLS